MKAGVGVCGAGLKLQLLLCVDAERSETRSNVAPLVTQMERLVFVSAVVFIVRAH